MVLILGAIMFSVAGQLLLKSGTQHLADLGRLEFVLAADPGHTRRCLGSPPGSPGPFAGCTSSESRVSVFTCAAGLVEPRRRDSAAISVPPVSKAIPFGGRFQTASQPKPCEASTLIRASSSSTSDAAMTLASRAPPLSASRSTITHSLPLSPTEAITR